MTTARDEMVDGNGRLRPHWRGLLGALSSYGEGGLAERARRLDEAFEEDGVTSILPGATQLASPWRCDPVPLLLAESEFRTLEAGLAQRARLLQAILADLYGPQTLLADGTLPPALVFANPGFLRPCRPSSLPPLLDAYAADLIRTPDGAWRVAADRTDTPFGIAYARENRRILSRIMPEAFRTQQVRQLRPFFDIWQDGLQRLAPPGRPNPNVALLTPGTSHRRWFEHMYLSREINCALVEAGDLTARGGALFLKTLKGLQQVDILIRRIEGRLTDPLELDGPTAAGVTGLLDAARAGTVRIANDPGTGLVEAPALAAFLPALARRLLGEELATPGIETIWLGTEAARARLMQAPQDWQVRPAFQPDAAPVSLPTMPPADRQALLARIEAQPWAWCARAAATASVVPTLTADGARLEPRPVILRLFCAADGDAWHAMPGGLARLVTGPAARERVSKDVWVLAEDRTDIIGPAVLAAPPLLLRRTTGDLPSRVADNLFWLGRYVERLERAARLSRAAIIRIGRGGSMLPREAAELQVLGSCLAEAGVIPKESIGVATTSVMGGALLAAVRDGGEIGSRFATVSALTESVRDRLTADMYATFTQTLRTARNEALRAGRSLDALGHAMVGVMRFSTVVAGAAAENMVRAGGWLFLELGRRLERAQSVASEVGFTLDLPAPRIEVGLRLALELCDSAITYRSRYLNILQPAPVLDLVLADPGNPRGLAFQFTQMHMLLDELSGTSGSAERIAVIPAGLLAEVETLVEEVLRAADQAEAATGLAQGLRGISAGIGDLSDQINRRYFALLPVAQSLGLDSSPNGLRGAA